MIALPASPLDVLNVTVQAVKLERAGWLAVRAGSLVREFILADSFVEGVSMVELKDYGTHPRSEFDGLLAAHNATLPF